MGVTVGSMVLRVQSQDIEFILDTSLYSMMILESHDIR